MSALFPIYLGIFLGLCGIGLTIAGIYALYKRSSTVQDRLFHYVRPPQEDVLRIDNQRRDQLSRFRYRLNKTLSIFTSEQLQLQLLRADWPITVTEFILIRMIGTGIVFAGGWYLTGSILVASGLALIAYLVPGTLLIVSIANRQKKFEEQLI
ncbi:MAG: hypothetical protein WHV66_07010, partial [Anaerolineales bacterium]